MSAHLFRAGFTSDPVEASVVVLVVALPLVAGVASGGFSAVTVGVVRLVVVFFGDSAVGR